MPLQPKRICVKKLLFYVGLDEGENMPGTVNRYSQIIETIFLKYFKKGTSEILFERSDIIHAAEKLSIKLPKNIGDILYSFRYRTQLPKNIVEKAPPGTEWIIRPAGRALYKFVLAKKSSIVPSPSAHQGRSSHNPPDARRPSPDQSEPRRYQDRPCSLARRRRWPPSHRLSREPRDAAS